MQNIFDSGIYLRLSKDDKNGSSESMSIANQRKLLEDFVKEKGWNLKETYIDDGYSGTNFERPDFKRMLKDIKRGYINCVITKDLSRLGRNYAKVGYYTEEFFIEYGVRFIAVNDDFDTMHDEENDIAPFKNVLNEWYPRDISKKVRQVKKKSAQLGLFMGSQAPYGYKKSPEDKHQLIIDDMSAPIVRRIFNDFASGMSARMIGDQLTSECIDSPRFYHAKHTNGQKPKPDEHNYWGHATITQILRNQVYIGNMVQGKRQVISFKNKKRRQVPPDLWITVEDTHDPIVSKELWERVERILNERIFVRRSKATKTVGTFSGLLICADCKAKLAYMSRDTKEGSNGVYRCSRYNNGGRAACTTHLVAEDTIEQIVLNDIRLYAQLATEEREALANRLLKTMNKVQGDELSQLMKGQRESENRLNTIKRNIRQLYEDKCNGAIPQTVFQSLLDEYLQEQDCLEQKITLQAEKIESFQSKKEEITSWLELIDQYVNLERLNRDIVMKLVDAITVAETVSVNGNRTQQIDIQYRFIGNLLQNEKEDIA